MRTDKNFVAHGRAPAKLVGGALALALALTASRSAGAEPQGACDADKLFNQAKALMTGGHTEQACSKFEESLRCERAGGTLLNLGECQAALGHFASAARSFTEARDLAQRAGRGDALDFAAARLADVEKRRSHIVLTAPAHYPKALVVRIDGEVVSVLEGSAFDAAVDNGEHTVRVEGPGFEPWTKKVSLAKEASSVVIVLPVPPAPASIARPPPRPSPLGPEAIGGWTLVGVGATTGIVGTVLGGMAIGLYRKGSERCPTIQCDDKDAANDIHAAAVDADAATGTLIGGAVLAAVGTILLFSAPHRAPSSKSAGWPIGIAPNGPVLAIPLPF